MGSGSGLVVSGPIVLGAGEQPILAIDKHNGGNIHVVFEASGGIKHAVLSPDGQILEAATLIPGSSVHAGGSGGHPGVAVDVNGNPYVIGNETHATTANREAYCFARIDGTWQPPFEIPNTEAYSSNNRPAMDSDVNGNIHFFMRLKTEAGAKLRYYGRIAGTSVLENVTIASNQSFDGYHDIASSPDGTKLHISWANSSTGQYYRSLENGQLSSQVVLGNKNFSAGVAITQQGQAHVLKTVGEGSGAYRASLYVGQIVNNSYVQEILLDPFDSPVGGGSFSSIAIDQNNNRYVTYYGKTSEKIHFRAFDQSQGIWLDRQDLEGGHPGERSHTIVRAHSNWAATPVHHNGEVHVYLLSFATNTPDISPPSIPENLSITSNGETQTSLTWNPSQDSESGIDHYVIFRDAVIVAESTSNSFLDLGLTENTTYQYEILAVNGAGLESVKPPAVSVTTLADTTRPTVEEVIPQISQENITLVFSELLETSSAVSLGNYSINNGVIINDALLNTVGQTVSLFTSLLSEGEAYSLTISNVTDQAQNPNPILPGTQLFFTLPITFPSAPSNLQATSVSSVQIDLQWMDNSQNETGFIIERTDGSTEPLVVNLVNYNSVNTTPSIELPGTPDSFKAGAKQVNDRDATWSEVPAMLEGEARLLTARDDKNDSGYNSMYEVNLSTNAVVYAVISPEYGSSPMEFMDTSWVQTGWVATSVGSAAGVFNIWKKEAPSGILILGADNDTTKQGACYVFKSANVWTETATVEQNITSFQDNGLPPDTSFTYRVRAFNDAGHSENSNEDSATTLITNTAPTVLSGQNITITLPELAMLQGTVTDDGLPNPPATVSTQWSQESGPGTVAFQDLEAVDTMADFSMPGEYVLRLSAYDGSLTSFDEITIAVNPGNTAPLVNAGEDLSISMTEVANLAASVSDDGLPNPPAALSLQWSKEDGPGMVTFGDEQTANSTVSFSEPGDYVLRLTANDTDLSGSDEIAVSVSLSNELTAYFSFDGNSNDESGLGNNGEVHGATQTTGVSGQAYEFDGMNDYIAIQNLKFDSPGEIEELSICGWVQTTFSGDNWFDNWSILDYDRNQYFSLYVRGNDGCVGFSTIDSNGVQHDSLGTSLVNDGQWHFVCAVFDGSDKIIYVDGLENNRAVDPHGAANIGVGGTRFGFMGDGSEAETFNGSRNGLYYKGLLDEVTLYKRSLSATEIAQEFEKIEPPDPNEGLLLSYSFDGNVQDGSANGKRWRIIWSKYRIGCFWASL